MCGAEKDQGLFLLGVHGIGMGTEGMAGRGALTTLSVFLVSSQALRQAKME